MSWFILCYDLVLQNESSCLFHVRGAEKDKTGVNTSVLLMQLFWGFEQLGLNHAALL